jgi:methylated-DNA-[protein]-cysteine S-methyltransferase
MLFSSQVATPFGPLTLLATADALVAVRFETHHPLLMLHRAPAIEVRRGEHAVLAQAERELHEHFAGERTRFSVPLEPRGTPFQQRVWHTLRAIPYGETRSYGQLAAAIDQPTASRAVGAANGRNPLAIFVPCHRVIGASGTLTGFAGGCEVKRFLLDLEARGPGELAQSGTTRSRPSVATGTTGLV